MTLPHLFDVTTASVSNFRFKSRCECFTRSTQLFLRNRSPFLVQFCFQSVRRNMGSVRESRLQNGPNRKIQRVEIGDFWGSYILAYERRDVFLNPVLRLFGAVEWYRVLLEATSFSLKVLIWPWKLFSFQNVTNVLLGVNLNIRSHNNEELSQSTVWAAVTASWRSPVFMSSDVKLNTRQVVEWVLSRCTLEPPAGFATMRTANYNFLPLRTYMSQC